MSSTHARCALLAILPCIGGCASTGTAFTVPTPDPMTPPAVVLDVYFPQGPAVTVTPAGSTPAMPTEVNADDEISLVASCTDEDSGCRNVQIYVEAITTAADGSMASAGLPTPLVQNLDANAAPGGTAIRQRAANVKLSVPQLRGGSAGLDLGITAYATNAHNQVVSTRRVRLFWSRRAPLTMAPCARFGPIGTDPPEVLDSRAVTVVIHNEQAADPTQMNFRIGFSHAVNPFANWKLDIEKVIGQAPTTAIFRLVNPTTQEKYLGTVDGRTCTGGQSHKADAGASTPNVTVTSADTTTIYLSVQNTGILANGISDVAIWNEATFWPAFGGKITTITWVPYPPPPP